MKKNENYIIEKIDEENSINEDENEFENKDEHIQENDNKQIINSYKNIKQKENGDINKKIRRPQTMNFENLTISKNFLKYKKEICLEFQPSNLKEMNKKGFKIIIPFNIETSKFEFEISRNSSKYIIKNDLEIYDYINHKVEYFNKLSPFKVNQITKFETTFKRWFFQCLLLIFIHLILSYILLCISMIFYLNVFVIYLSVDINLRVNSLLKQYFIGKNFKNKILEIQKILNKENLTDYCIHNQITWNSGYSGYWIELNIISNLKKYSI